MTTGRINQVTTSPAAALSVRILATSIYPISTSTKVRSRQGWRSLDLEDNFQMWFVRPVRNACTDPM